MSDSYNKLTDASLFIKEAEEIITAYNILQKISKPSDNIKSGGNEVEFSVKEFFRTKLPSKYYVNKGHIVDINLNLSPEFDVIISDNFKTPILFKSRDSVDYFIYESVYSIGEVKSSWYTDHMEDCYNRMFEFKKNMKRDSVSPNYIDTGSGGIYTDSPTTSFPSKNPLFYFLFVVNSSKINFDHIKKAYVVVKKWEFLPSIICILDYGIYVNINRKSLDKNDLIINLYPEYEKPEDTTWVLIRMENPSEVLASLYYLLLEHLQITVLLKPTIRDYMNKMFKIGKDSILEI